MRWRTGCCWVLLHLVTAGCASQSPQTQAQRLGMVVSTVRGTEYDHRIFAYPSSIHGAADQSPSSATAPLAVFLLDGDGNAFLQPTLVARDPTPRRSRLISMAPGFAFAGPVFYLGRPCYHGLASAPGCGPRAWTLDRFSVATVNSLSAAIVELLQPGQRVMLLGYSGGGTLAVLVAAELEHYRANLVRAVLTYGAPLDLQAWAAFHGYTPLSGSVDPATRGQSWQHLCQRHLFGRRDKEIPPALVQRWRGPATAAIENVDSDHTCCWEQTLQRALQELLAQCP